MRRPLHWIMESTQTCFNMGLKAFLCFFFSHRKKMKPNGSLNVWYGVWNKGVPAQMRSWLLVLTQGVGWSEISNPMSLTLWWHHAAVWERKGTTAMVGDSKFLSRTAPQTTQTSVSFSTLILAKECWLNVWPYIYNMSWDTNVIFANVVFHLLLK